MRQLNHWPRMREIMIWGRVEIWAQWLVNFVIAQVKLSVHPERQNAQRFLLAPRCGS